MAMPRAERLARRTTRPRPLRFQRMPPAASAALGREACVYQDTAACITTEAAEQCRGSRLQEALCAPVRPYVPW